MGGAWRGGAGGACRGGGLLGQFAVAAVRGLELASAFVISDSLAELVRSTRFHSPEVASGLVSVYQAAVAALLAGT